MIGEIPSHFTEQKTKERSRHKGQKWAKQVIQNKKRNSKKKEKKLPNVCRKFANTSSKSLLAF